MSNYTDISPIIYPLNKFCEAAELEGKTPQSLEQLRKATRFLNEEIQETEDALEDLEYVGDNYYASLNIKLASSALEETLDGFADVAFIAINGIYKTLRFMGYSAERSTELTDEVMWRVASANLTKLIDGKPVKNSEGKVVKPVTFKAPQYRDIVECMVDSKLLTKMI